MSKVFVAHLSRPYELESPVSGEEYVAWILCNDPVHTALERNQIAEALIKTGCRFAVCSGYQCSQWDDAIGWATKEFPRTHEPRREAVVYTSWHEHESLEETARFFVRHTGYEGFRPDNFVIVSVGNGPYTEKAENLVHAALERRFAVAR
jgi:hypothetical protein